MPWLRIVGIKSDASTWWRVSIVAGILGNAAPVGIDVHHPRNTPLANVAGAGNLLRLPSCLVQGGQKDGNQQCDDSNHDQQLNQRKTAEVFSANLVSQASTPYSRAESSVGGVREK